LDWIMSAPSTVVRRLSPALPLLALALVGAPGCSSTDEADGPVTGYADGGYDEEGSEEDGSSGDPSGGETGTDDGGQDDGAPSDPPPEPDEAGRGVPEDPEEACDAQTDVALWLSPDDSNSMASPVRVREAALGGWGTVQSVAIRTWEFFNYYGFGYPAAAPGTLAVSPSLLQPAGAVAGEYLLQVGISSETITDEARAPIDVTLVLDTSGSMEGEAMASLKHTCFAIAASLKAGDTVSLITWNTENAVVLGAHPVAGPDDPVLLAKVDALSASGGTDLHAGLVAGYALAQQSFTAGRTSRVVLVSDGGANAGITDLEIIAQHASGASEDGIDLVGVGVGDAATYRDDLMDAVTDAGKGASVFIADVDDAWAMFHDGFVATMGVAARDVQVRLDMPPGFEIVSTSAEEVSTDVSDVEPQHLAPNDAMVLHQRIRTCAPELVTDDATITTTVIWIDAVTLKPRQVQRVSTVAELLAADPAPLLKGTTVFAYAEALKAYKQADADGRAATMTEAFAALEQAEAALPGDAELAEIRQVLEALAE
jgi:Ca-activated chloride channel family protein